MRSSLSAPASHTHALIQGSGVAGLLSVLLGSCLLLGCDTNVHPDGFVRFVTGAGDAPWAAPPAVERVRLEFVQATSRSTLAEVSAPPQNISLGNAGPEYVIGHFEANGLTKEGAPVVHGSTVPFYLLGFSGISVPLFVARTGGFSEAPNPLLLPHTRPIPALVSGAYLFVVDGGSSALDIYNIAMWEEPSAAAPLPQTVKSLAVSGTELLMLNDDSAQWIELTTAVAAAVSPPAGLTFAEVIGGKTLVASDQTAYIVGATRTEGAATNKVLRIDPDGSLHTLLLGSPRLGAAAALLDDALLVAGGSAVGAGAELYAVGANGFRSLALPPDTTQGAGLVGITATTAWLVGGRDASGTPTSPRRIDIDCSSDCLAAELGTSLELNQASAFRLDENLALVVGETEDEQDHVYLLDASGDAPTLTEQPLHTPRARASAVVLPNGQMALVGGTDVATGEPALGMDVYFR